MTLTCMVDLKNCVQTLDQKWL